MSTFAIFLVGVFTVALLVSFVYLTAREMTRSPLAMMPFYGESPDEAERRAKTWDTQAAAFVGSSALPAAAAELVTPPARPLKILVATDGSPCSDRAVQSVAMRPCRRRWQRPQRLPPSAISMTTSRPRLSGSCSARQAPGHCCPRPRSDRNGLRANVSRAPAFRQGGQGDFRAVCGAGSGMSK